MSELTTPADLPAPALPTARPLPDLPVSVSVPIVVGILAILAFAGGFGIWSVSAPIAGASVATGTLVATGRNKVVQHLNGGVVKDIFVEEGDHVDQGTPLVELDGTDAIARLAILSRQRHSARALEARLVAERDGLEELSFPQELSDAARDPEVAQLIEDQTAEFNAGLDRYEQELIILEQRIRAQEEEIVGLELQIEANELQHELIEQEIAMVQELFDQALAGLDRLLALNRSRADLQGDKGEYTARIAKIRQEIIEGEQRISHHKATRIEEAIEALTTARTELSELENEIARAEYVVDSLVLTSPVEGVVVALTVHSQSAVIAAGDPVVEILPTDVELVAEVEIDPADIDVISIGQEAQVTLSALNRRTTPQVDAEVIYVSADHLVERSTNRSYYLSRLSLIDIESEGVERSDLYPGMQIEAYIQTGERTFVEYLLRPLFDSFRRAFREE